MNNPTMKEPATLEEYQVALAHARKGLGIATTALANAKRDLADLQLQLDRALARERDLEHHVTHVGNAAIKAGVVAHVPPRVAG